MLFNIRRSSNGRTAGSDPANRGSTPCLRAKNKNTLLERVFVFLFGDNGLKHLTFLAPRGLRLPVSEQVK